MIKLIVFDFDGTLADTRKIVSMSIQSSMRKHSYSIGEKEILKVIGHAPLPGTLSKLGVRVKDVNMMVEDIRNSVKLSINKIKPSSDIYSLKKINIKRIILSNSDSKIIKKILDHWRIKFDYVSGAESRESKITRFNKILRKYKVKPKEVVYFGDLDIDIKLAKEIGCYSAAISTKYSWGSAKSLLNAKPDFILYDIKDVESLIDSLV
jgi:phosphoglycolate phosphatase